MSVSEDPSRLSAREIGTLGESLACAYLESRGHVIIERNWRCRRGEIDIISRVGDSIVAVEVKARRGTGYGAPLEAITYLKARRLRTLLTLWLRHRQPNYDRLRVDGVGVTFRARGEPLLEHVEGIA